MSKPVDLEGFRAELRASDLEDAADGLIDQFLADVVGQIVAVEDAVAARDPARVHRAAHDYKGSASTLCARRLAELLHQLEQMGVAGDLGSAAALVVELRTEHDAVVTFLRETRGA